MSSLTTKSIVGMHKGKRFVIVFSKSGSQRSKSKLVIEINNKRFYPKDSREIVRLLNS